MFIEWFYLLFNTRYAVSTDILYYQYKVVEHYENLAKWKVELESNLDIISYLALHSFVGDPGKSIT